MVPSSEIGSTAQEGHSGPEQVWKGPGGPFRWKCAPGVFFPSTTSRVIAESLEIPPGATVVDVGCGSGLLSFVAAGLGAGRVVGCDISPAAVACAKSNAATLGVTHRVEFRVGDLLEAVGDLDADVVIADVSGIPDGLARVSGWFPDGRGGGPSGAELPVRLIAQAPDRLRSSGRLYLPTASLQAEEPVLAAAREAFGSMVPVARRSLPLSGAMARSGAVAEAISTGLVKLTPRGSRLLWDLTVWRCEAPRRARGACKPESVLR